MSQDAEAVHRVLVHVPRSIPPATRQVLCEWGVRFPCCNSQSCSMCIELPLGWTAKPAPDDHELEQTYILDSQGRIRASYMPNSSFLRLWCRFWLHIQFRVDGSQVYIKLLIYDGQVVIHELPDQEEVVDPRDKHAYHARLRLLKQGAEWLIEHGHDGWTSPKNHW